MLMPAWVTATISIQSFSVNFAIAAWSPVSTDLNGSVSFHSGWSGAISASRSRAKRPWP